VLIQFFNLTDLEAVVSRKQAILQVAGDFFSELGYRETSMSEVARFAGVADGTVFYNYHSKEALYLAVLDEFREHIRLALDAFLASHKFSNGLDMVEGLLGFYITLADDMAKRFLLLHRYDCYRLARSNSDFHQHLEDIYNCIVDAFEQAIVRGQQDGSIDDVPARKYAFIVFTNVDGLMRLKTFSLYQTETLYSELVSACRRMLASGDRQCR
jgi:AcrR family transcriptional regulator